MIDSLIGNIEYVGVALLLILIGLFAMSKGKKEEVINDVTLGADSSNSESNNDSDGGKNKEPQPEAETSSFDVSYYGYNNEPQPEAETSKKFRDFLQNQIDTLAQEGSAVWIDQITICYFFHLVQVITKKPVSMGSLHHLMRNTFTDDTSVIFGWPRDAMFSGAWSLFRSDSEINVKLAALYPIVWKEYDVGYGEFLIRQAKQRKKPPKKLPPDWCPSKVPPWSAKDLP